MWTEATDFPHLIPLFKKSLLSIVFDAVVAYNGLVNLDDKLSFLEPQSQTGI